MGCCNTKKSKDDSSVEEVKKEYSWDKRETVDLSKFTFKDLEGGVAVKGPGDLDGDQFSVENCTNTNIFLLDHTAAVTVDNCVGCQIITGPIRGSIFLRNCHDCKVMTACQQFRTRDCRKVDVFLLCTTQPIIEATSKIRFGCYQLSYEGLRTQFTAASMSVFNNSWSQVHDFSPDPDQQNWTLLSGDTAPGAVLNLDHGGENSNNLSVDSSDSVVPLSLGGASKTSIESCFAVVFHGETYCEDATHMISRMADGGYGLVQSKEISLSELEVGRIFSEGGDKFAKLSQSGPVIGLEFNGDNCIEACRRIVEEMGNNKIYVSSSAEASNREIEQFYNYCEMQMNV